MALEAARHLCQEARVVLTSLRGGPPMVARGDLAQELMDLRALVRQHSRKDSSSDDVNGNSNGSSDTGTGASNGTHLETENDSSQSHNDGGDGDDRRVTETDIQNAFEPDTNLDLQPQPQPQAQPQSSHQAEHVGIFARPFLNVVMDPRAAGPHTLVALRALHRLLDSRSLLVTTDRTYPAENHDFTVALEPLTKGVLNCKFEQTDAGADEAVEMAIADLLALMVQINRRALQPGTLMDAFNTVFVTRNTFVHSPALCYHFEDVLTAMCKAVFGDLDNMNDAAGISILEFLVNQLLHTPFVGGIDEASKEAQRAHDATRVLCLTLARAALQTAFEENVWTLEAISEWSDSQERNLLHIIQDELSLSLLMTGQAVWSVQETSDVIAPGVISLEVLSEICSTLSTLWNITIIRKFLVSQFEAIFTGFYQRALVLLRKRVQPTDSMAFHSNLFFDSGVEIILESLVDIMTVHDHQQTIAEGNGGSLETLFAFFDCNVKRSDVAVGLMVDLCRCTGSKVDAEGDIFDSSIHGDLESGSSAATDASILAPTDGRAGKVDPEFEDFLPLSEEITVDGYRPVPPHLRELCAEAIIGGMKCLFSDDHPSDETKAERNQRKSILARHVSPAPQSWSDLNRVTSSHHMRNIKSKKRLMRRAAQMFNKKSSKGIEFLVHSGVIEEPVTPKAVASFLRNAIVVGLDKKAVGVYLGEMGKSPEAGKSPPVWQRDWFHNEALEAYCSLFRFEGQSLLDGLRMFLAAFRLPGEAQQIDRILEAFSDSCSRVCEEGCNQLFSEDPKRASDAAYLLSFSIIMLNTDQHNDNIREDRKMSKSDFVKNNSDYGRDITDEGKQLPREYLEGIYDSIRDEEIRTEGEGADGSMTVERWKDVLRGSAEETLSNELPSVHDAEDLTELVLEHLWMPIMSSVRALWGATTSVDNESDRIPDSGPTGMLGAQGARLGMDMAWDMLVGVRRLGRNDIFRKIFNCVCKYSTLLDYKYESSKRSYEFAHSVESQGAFVVAFRVAKEAADEIGADGWKRIWMMLFELRDLKMLGGGIATRGKSLMMESDFDFLSEMTRREWNMRLTRKGHGDNKEAKKSSGVSSVFGAMGRALFGSGETQAPSNDSSNGMAKEMIETTHKKEQHIIWDELAASDDEDENTDSSTDTGSSNTYNDVNDRLSLGARFESLLIREDLLLSKQRETPVTGLERVEDANALFLSHRARVRKRLAQSCDYAVLITESRFMDEKSIGEILEALIALISTASGINASTSSESLDRDGDFSTRLSQAPISPASEAMAEILIAEIAIRNRDRLASLWHSILHSHYLQRINSILLTYTKDDKSQAAVITGSMEKCVTGLLRISQCAVYRGKICNEILEIWTVLNNIESAENKASLANSFDHHLAEGLWRITRGVDDTSDLTMIGWSGLMALTNWCAERGSVLPPVKAESIGKTVGLSDDDPSLQAYRSMHFLLNVSEAKEKVPGYSTKIIRTLLATGEIRRCPKLGVACLDLLQTSINIVESSAIDVYREGVEHRVKEHWEQRWFPILEAIVEAGQSYSISNVRQHALSVLTEIFLQSQAAFIPTAHLCRALQEACIPLVFQRMTDLLSADRDNDDFVVSELELCISLLFKPLRHHVQTVIEDDLALFAKIWSQILDVVRKIEDKEAGNNEAFHAVKELILEHLKSLVLVLVNLEVLSAETSAEDDVTAITWASLTNLNICKNSLEEWKTAAKR